MYTKIGKLVLSLSSLLLWGSPEIWRLLAIHQCILQIKSFPMHVTPPPRWRRCSDGALGRHRRGFSYKIIFRCKTIADPKVTDFPSFAISAYLHKDASWGHTHTQYAVCKFSDVWYSLLWQTMSIWFMVQFSTYLHSLIKQLMKDPIYLLTIPQQF